MNESIFGHMEASLQDYLTTLATRATAGGEHAAAALARAELPRIIGALKALLDEHHPDEQGRCPTCRTRLFTRAPAPCRAYLTAHLCLLMTEDTEAASQPQPRPAPFRALPTYRTPHYLPAARNH